MVRQQAGYPQHAQTQKIQRLHHQHCKCGRISRERNTAASLHGKQRCSSSNDEGIGDCPRQRGLQIQRTLSCAPEVSILLFINLEASTSRVVHIISLYTFSRLPPSPTQQQLALRFAHIFPTVRRCFKTGLGMTQPSATDVKSISPPAVLAKLSSRRKLYSSLLATRAVL